MKLLTILLLSALCASAQTNTPLRTVTAVVWTIVGTNSVEIGTLTTTGGAERFRVMDDSWITNIVAVIPFEGDTHSVILKSEKGPHIGERRVRKEAVTPPMPK